MAALAYTGWCAMLFFAQDSMIFPRHAAASPLPSPPYPGTRVIRVGLPEGGEMQGWLVPPPEYDATVPGPVVIYCHGNAEIIDGQGWFVQCYGQMGCAVFLPEYRGYGRSPGRPSEAAIVADCSRFCDELFKRPDVDRARIAIHGRSLGGGVAAQIAARHKPAALILESTFTSVAAFSRRYMVPEFLVRHPFRTDEVLQVLDVPTLIFHGTHDEVVPVWHGRRLGELARNGTYVEYDCGHDDSPGAGRESDYWGRIEDLLVRTGVVRRPASSSAFR